MDFRIILMLQRKKRTKTKLHFPSMTTVEDKMLKCHWGSTAC